MGEINKNEYEDIFNNNIEWDTNAADLAVVGNTINLVIDENKINVDAGNYNIDNCGNIIGPKNFDVFINNGRRNHLQYLSLQDNPYVNTIPFDFKKNKNGNSGDIKDISNIKFANNKPYLI